MLVPGTDTPSSSPPCPSFASASMADCALFYEAEGFALFETLCCRSHTRIYSLPSVILETRLLLQHPGLLKIKILIYKTKIKQEKPIKLTCMICKYIEGCDFLTPFNPLVHSCLFIVGI